MLLSSYDMVCYLGCVACHVYYCCTKYLRTFQVKRHLQKEKGMFKEFVATKRPTPLNKIRSKFCPCVFILEMILMDPHPPPPHSTWYGKILLSSSLSASSKVTELVNNTLFSPCSRRSQHEDVHSRCDGWSLFKALQNPSGIRRLASYSASLIWRYVAVVLLLLLVSLYPMSYGSPFKS